ncbi:hypothetical protein BH11PSE3_BH11PSE3_11190 [soil metagenome]
MSAVAHYIEEEGVPTTGISLVREHTAQMQPPRALWVSFDLGRPFGAPHDPGLQTRTLRAVLALLERTDGPAVLEDFSEDAPATAPEEMEGLACPVPLPRLSADQAASPVAAVEAEMALLAPWYELAASTRGGSTVGVSGLDVAGALAFLGDLLSAGAPKAAPGLSVAQTVRFATEDVRAWYLEAASARPGGSAGPRALADWFWGETAAGRLILRLHPLCAASPDQTLRALARGALVPRVQRHRL